MSYLPSFLADPADKTKVSITAVLGFVVAVVVVMALVHRTPLRRVIG